MSLNPLLDASLKNLLLLKLIAIIRTDINNIISTLSEKDSNLCQLLKVFTITEVSVITKIPKTTIYRTLERIRDKFSILEKL
ncbi:helix-turn-helix domain-containing protein [Wolbachia endosymbiont of Trichogramma pretiosum]|uniref:helix-turn-helix domain-containing protein n=1 Tax=Wolbachia endosymbiont of Trichogramma pretiosum TaxID=125593 RepID=UPI000B138E3A|nr:helix-turn-helix domain-containing protein [Wolbachia endosymbiont of Trichogramma pretiosum]